MKDDNIVTLSETELWKLERFAAWRNDPKIGVVPDKSFAARVGNDNYERNLVGLLGEYAVAKYFREPMDLFIDLGGDNNITDLVIGNMTTSVKCSYYAESPHLIFNTLDEFRQDVAILASVLEPSRVQLHGWTSRERFRELHKRRDFGYGERCVVDESDLYRMIQLKAIAYDRWRRAQWGGLLMRSA
jgi:hypothetical protein